MTSRYYIRSLEVLAACLSEVEALEDISDLDFQNTFNQVRAILELNDGETSDMFGISLPTIRRWSNGESAPHPLIRNSTFRGVREEVEKRIQHLKEQQGPESDTERPVIPFALS